MLGNLHEAEIEQFLDCLAALTPAKEFMGPELYAKIRGGGNCSDLVDLSKSYLS